MKKTTLALMVSSFTLVVILNFLLNLVTGYLATDLQPYKNFIYIGLVLVFMASLGLFIWEQARGRDSSGVIIRQTAKSGGQIRRAPVKVKNSTIGVEQSASKSGEIVDSIVTATAATSGSVKQQATGEKSKIEDSDITIT